MKSCVYGADTILWISYQARKRNGTFEKHRFIRRTNILQVH